jgi:hypothetical protein
MKRDDAIALARAALKREHVPFEATDQFGHQALALLDALEALGVLKFDEARAAPPFQPYIGLVHGDEKPTTSSDVLSDLMLGPRQYELTGKRYWILDRVDAWQIVKALEDAGFKIVRTET